MASPKPNAPDNSDSVLRSVISLALCIHLVCVAVVLASNFRRSPLQTRLVSLFAFYTRLLNFDPDRVPYYYTLGRPYDDDAWLVVDLYASADQPVTQQERVATTLVPEGGSNWLGERRRGFALAKLLAAAADPENENEDVSSEIARSVGSWAMRQTHNQRAVVRCVRRFSQPFDLSALNPGFPPDRPTDRAYDVPLYEADVWIDEDQQVQVLRRASRAEVAPRQSSVAPPAVRSGAGESAPAP